MRVISQQPPVLTDWLIMEIDGKLYLYKRNREGLYDRARECPPIFVFADKAGKWIEAEEARITHHEPEPK